MVRGVESEAEGSPGRAVERLVFSALRAGQICAGPGPPPDSRRSAGR